MRVMAIIKATRNSEAGVMPSEELLTAMGKYNEALASSSDLPSEDGLQPSSKGKRIVISLDERRVDDSPFESTTELAAGHGTWKDNSLAEDVEWAKGSPAPMPGEETTIELRPLFEMENFGDEMALERREQEDRL